MPKWPNGDVRQSWLYGHMRAALTASQHEARRPRRPGEKPPVVWTPQMYGVWNDLEAETIADLARAWEEDGPTPHPRVIRRKRA